MPLSVAILYGSVRQARLGIRVARFVETTLTARGHHVDLVDPLELDLPLLDKRYGDHGDGAPPALERLAGIYRACDGFMVVSGEYNHGIPPALKNLLDHFEGPHYARRPSGIICYSVGSFGGVRVIQPLRATLSALGAVTIPGVFTVPGVGDAFSENGTPNDEVWHRRFRDFLLEFEWYAEALKAARTADGA